jgi:acetyl-CoA C-acetyltransferase
MTPQRSVVFAEPVRTAIGTFGGSLKEIPAPNLGAVAIGGAVARAKLRPDEVETVVMGNVVQAGTKMNPARQAAVHAGLPVTTPALTVNRVCGSGAQAIVSAAQEIALGKSTSPLRAEWRIWISRPISFRARAGAIGWATANFTTACCATA